MEQRHYQYRRREPFSEERFIIRDHGKIQEKRSITHIVLNVLFCAILFTVSFFYILVALMRGLMPMAVVIVCLNAFFFVMLWGMGVSIPDGRKSLYSCLLSPLT